ncbi:MAG: hypothetical protein LBM08_03150 [Dysgonamonadaceae bacterium]|jgi:hypothetical protein|nr:hypothetical protein [Dysgonamonadaceae bacterium]
MELDELKKTWAALDSRLKENDLLKETIILEIIQGKANKSVNRLLNWDVFNVVGSIVFIPVIWNFLERFENKLALFALIYAIVLLAISVIWYSYKIYGLMKFDFAKSVSNNIYYVNRYNLQVKWEKIISIIALFIITVIAVFYYAEAKVSVFLWIVLSCMIIFCGLFLYWYYRRVYDKNIGSVLKSLEELKALKEKD